MQATSMKQFVISRSGATVIALSILIAGAAGVAALTLGNEFSGNQTVESARVMPQAYVSAGQGEGLVDASSNLSAATTLWPRAFVAPGQGEGFVDATNAAAITNRLQAHIGLGQGEGIVDATNAAALTNTLQAHIGLGQGEGFVGPGATVDSRLLTVNSHNAYWSFGQGEGLVDATHQPPAPRPIKAYSHPEQGEGLVGPGN